ncbi:MATE family efflux transporter [Radiobacillus kanasensis]|uniref:MATE family efflux transporter n=1 Tax=Radiobacillus kanasensis TaxID=2844358 RepID=UPI001E2B9AEF|nr:MATE family efflux transporter [Radiobacillus kanasensis]UFT99174.1 MATE family efflux transporter [Radiobacillus kanasensis]
MGNQHTFTEGNIWRQMVVFSAPIMVTNLLQTSYQFVDSLWVGNLLGAEALGAVAIASTVIFTILSFIIGLNNATLTILSQQKGRDDDEGLARYVNAFVVTLTCLALVLGFVGFMLAEPILRFLGTPENMLEEATVYLKVNSVGIIFLLGYNFIGTVLRAIGDSKTPLTFVMVAVGLNVVLDPVFISLFDLGVEGAALATVSSQGIAFLYGMYDVIRKGKVPFRMPTLPTRKEVGLILNLGIPSGLQMAVISAGVAAIMSVVNGHGPDVVAGFSAAQRLDSILMLPAQALGTAVNSMAGQNIGLRKWDRVRLITKYGVLYNLGVMLVFAFLLILLAGYGISLFIQDAAAVAYGSDYLKIVAFFYPFLGINFVLNGVVRASGAMYQVLVLNIISFWLLRYPVTYLFSNWFGENGIAIGMGVSFIISSLCAIGYYMFGKWRQKEVFKAAGK